MAATNPVDGAAYFHAPGVASVTWDQGASCVLVEWEGWADSTEFRALLEAGVRALVEHRGSSWLADCRRQKALKPADQDWGDKVWLPLAVGSGLKRFAIVLPKSELATINLQDRGGTMRAAGLEVQYFATFEEARAWLSG